MKYLRVQDQVENTGAAVPGALSPSDFSGTWFNTNSYNPEITCVICKAEGSVLSVRFKGNGSSEPSDWGEVTAELLYAANIQGGPAMSFVTSFDLGFKKVQVGANLNQGLLVIATYHRSQNDTGASASNYFAREFFHRADQS
ncbi:MAG TPA: hypothetical protein VKD65_13330 [Candidatus Angelobacter sp.]|nr:hypothetical protein [Candidatus Angelobacter sp.]